MEGKKPADYMGESRITLLPNWSLEGEEKKATWGNGWAYRASKAESKSVCVKRRFKTDRGQELSGGKACHQGLEKSKSELSGSKTGLLRNRRVSLGKADLPCHCFGR